MNPIRSARGERPFRTAPRMRPRAFFERVEPNKESCFKDFFGIALFASFSRHFSASFSHRFSTTTAVAAQHPLMEGGVLIFAGAANADAVQRRRRSRDQDCFSTVNVVF